MRFVQAFALLAFLLATAGPVEAIGLGSLKKKAEKKLKEKIEKKEDEAVDDAARTAEGAAEGAVSGSDDSGETSKKGGTKSGQPTKGSVASKEEPKRLGAVAAVSAKFDFIPGDRTLLAEDFAALKPGALSSAWQPRRGTAAIEEVEGARWLVPKSESVTLKFPLTLPLPLKWTLELDYALTSLEGASFRLAAETAKGEPCWSASWPQAAGAVSVEGGGATASGAVAVAEAGRHRIAFAANGAALRVYLDRERVVSVPSVLGGDPPTALILTIQSPGSHPRVAAVRVAAGPASVKTRLAEGSLTTYGVRFDPTSDEVRPESAPVLREIASYLEADTAAKLSIQAPADDVAEESRRADRAKKRASAVRDVLVSQFGVASTRLIVGEGGPVGKGSARPSTRAGSPPVVFSKN